MEQKNSQIPQQNTPVDQQQRPVTRDAGQIQIDDFVRIFDPETKKIYLETRG